MGGWKDKQRWSQKASQGPTPLNLLLSPGLGRPGEGAGCLQRALPSLWRIELGCEMNFSSTNS